MNVVPFLCPMALNLHQKRPSPVTSGWIFHRPIQRETAAPHSFWSRWCGKVTPVIRHSATQYDTKLRHHHSFWWAMVQGNYPRHPPFRHTIRREIAAPSFVLMTDGAAKLPPSSAIPPHNTTRNRSTIIRFAGRWCKEITPLGVILSLIPRTLSLHLAIVLPGAAVGFVLRLHAL